MYQIEFLTKENLNRIIEKHRLKLIQEISQSRHSRVFKVETETKQICALKITPLVFEFDQVDVNNLMPLKIESPYLLKYYKTFFAEPDLICFLMEYCDGGSAVDLMNCLNRPLNEREIESIVHLTLIGLQFLHSHGIIHNDIKAGNILFTQSGQLKIADASIAFEVSSLNELNSKLPKPSLTWKAPEYFEEKENRHLSVKSDIWSLGITILEMFQKIPPNPDADFNQLQVLYCTSLILPSAPNKSSKLFQDFVKKLIVKDPSNRPGANELLNHPFIQQISVEQSNEVIKDLSNRYVRYMIEKFSDASENSYQFSDDYDFVDDKNEEESSNSEDI